MLVDFRERINRPSIPDTAHILHHSAKFCKDVEEAKKLLDTMIDAGHRYKQLEASLGDGVCLVLPTDIGESK